MRCFLHVGTEKTATTTIQAFFDANRSRLLEKGFIYTRAAGSLNNRDLSVVGYDPGRRDDFTKSRSIHSDDELLEFQIGTIRRLKKEIDEVRSATSTIIFSSEQFQSRLTTVDDVARLRHALLRLGIDDVSVLIYLRRPADIANSLFSTLLKLGATIECPPGPENVFLDNICNHKKSIERFASAFGAKAVVPRLFDRNEFENNSIIDDVRHVIGIPDDAGYEIPQDRNESISALGVALLRHLNKTIPFWIRNKPNPVRGNLIAYVERHFSDSKYFMSRDLYERYEIAFRDSNDWVRKNYFPTKKRLFSDDIPEASAIDFSDAQLLSIAAFIADIWNDKEQRISRLSSISTA